MTRIEIEKLQNVDIAGLYNEIKEIRENLPLTGYIKSKKGAIIMDKEKI